MRKPLVSFLQKELYHILRDPRTLLILLGMPVVQVLLFGFALSTQIRQTPIAVLDYARSTESSSLTAKIDANRYFTLERQLTALGEVEEVFKEGRVRMLVVIPESFSLSKSAGESTQVQLITDGSDLNFSSQIVGFMQTILQDFAQGPSGEKKALIAPQLRMLYNPQLEGAPNFVPGLMALVLLIICVLMTAIAIVREKESGTMEILLVTPLPSWLVILGKTLPYLILSLIILGLILFLSTSLLGLPIAGSLLLLLVVSVLFILVNLLLGILVSIFTHTQQNAMLISLAVTMLPTVMLSGFMFPIENMPAPLQVVAHLIPSKWYYEAVVNTLVKGVGLEVVWKQAGVLVLMLSVLFTLAVRSFKIRLE